MYYTFMYIYKLLKTDMLFHCFAYRPIGRTNHSMTIASALVVCLSILTMVHADCTDEISMWNVPKKPSHPCVRRCVKGHSMICHYDFTAELYYTMSKACYDCPQNISDCYREDCVHMDGIPRAVYTVNRQIPGPTIEVCEGDKIFVRLHNEMNEETTSIHWHGMLQVGTPYMDGVPMITQCPISPGTTFDYIFHARNPGTHFWHSHSGAQRTDGMFGGLIVHQPDHETIHRDLYDEDIHLMLINDWAHANGAEVLMMYWHRGGPNAGATMMVNGRGCYYNDTVKLTYTPLEVFHVEQGKRYRFRVCDASSFACPKEISIDNHTMLAIASDGWAFTPVTVSSIVLNPAERVDFVLHANQPVGNYWVRIVGFLACDETKAHGVSILHYKGADCKEPSEAVGYDLQPPPDVLLNPINSGRNAPGEINFAELSAPYYHSRRDLLLREGHPNKVLLLPFDFKTIDNPKYHKRNVYGYNQVNDSMKTFTPQFHETSFRKPNVPPMSQFCELDPTIFCNSRDHNNCTGKYCECTMMYELELYDFVRLILINLGENIDVNHPFHLHGHAFQVVAMDKYGSNITTEYVRKLHDQEKIPYNFNYPVYKDTVTVTDGGYTVLHFIADNPGVWFFHCHLEMHLETKMAIMFKVGDPTDFPPVPEGFPICGVNHYGDYTYCGKRIVHHH